MKIVQQGLYIHEDRIWFFCLKMSKNRGDKTHFARRTSLYRIGLVELSFFKCDEIRLRYVGVSLSKQRSFF